MISDIDEVISEATAVVVEVLFPDTPFGGVQVYGINEDVVQVTFSPVPAPEPSIPDTPTEEFVVQQPTYPTPNTNSEVIACLQAAKLCA